MKKVKFLINTINISTLLCLMSASNMVMAGSLNVCITDGTATGPSSTGNEAFGCKNNTGITLYEFTDGAMNANSRALIGLGIDRNGKSIGTLYFGGEKAVMDTTLSLQNNKITAVADGTAISDAVNLGQLNTAKADAISQSKEYTDAAKVEAQAYTDKAKTDAITTSNAYTDAAKTDAITTSNAYTDAAKTEIISISNAYTDAKINNINQNIGEGSIYYDKNTDGTVNKELVTLSGETGTKITNVADGQINSSSKDTINGSQLNTTNQAVGEFLGGGAGYDNDTQTFKAPTYQVGNNSYQNVGDAVSVLNQVDIATNKRIDGMNKRVDSLETKLNQGLAMSAAINGLFQPYGVGKFNVSVAGGGHGSQGALAIGSGYRFNENFAIKSGLAAVPGKGKPLYNIGVNFEW